MKLPIVILLSVFYIVGCMANASASAVGLPARYLREDERLNSGIRLQTRRAYLGEVVEQISRQSKVPLVLRTDNRFSGVILSAALNGTPLYNVMDSLCSVLSLEGADWRWMRSGQYPKWRYDLVPSTSFVLLAQRLDEQAQKGLEAQSELMTRLAFIAPEERRLKADSLAKSMFDTDTRLAGQFVDANSPAANYIWEGMRLFAQLLTPQERLNVLRGSTIIIPFDRLADDALAFAKASAPRIFTYTVDNGVKSEPKEVVADALIFRNSRNMGKDKTLNAQVMVGVRMGRSLPARTLVGFMDVGLKKRIEAQWMLPGDTPTVSDNPIVSERSEVASIPEGAGEMEAGLFQMSRHVPCSFIAVLPERQAAAPEATQGMTLAAYLTALKKASAYVMHKWRKGILLLNHPVWFYGDKALSPYQIVKRLRAERSRREGLLTLQTIFDTALACNEYQAERLAEEFPIIGEAARDQTMATLYRLNPNVLSEQGIPVDASVLRLIAPRLNLPPGLNDLTPRRVRIVETGTQTNGVRERLARLEVIAGEGVRIPVSTFSQKASAEKITPKIH